MQRLRGLRAAFTRHYLTIDGRSLAAGRIGLAALLLLDLLRRVGWIRDLYTNAGLLPNHTVLWRPWQPYQFSPYFMASLPFETAVLFALSTFCFLCLLVGYRTRLFHLLSFAMITGLHERDLIAENGGTVAMATLLVWTAFLPLGRRFSVDALRARLRGRTDEGPAELAADRLEPPDRRPAVSLAALAVLLQLAAVYWFNCVHKSGATWHGGTAIHYVLQQERIVTSFGVWFREHVPFWVTKQATFATLAIEASAPFLILSPLFPKQARLLAVGLLTALHVGIALLINVGIFSPAMIAFYPLLIDGQVWDRIERVAAARRGRSRRVIYDADCGVCFQVVRILARMDVLHRLTWAPSTDAGAWPESLDRSLAERTMVVVDPESGRVWTRSDGFAEIFGALPFGGLLAWPLRLPGLRAVAGRAYDAFARNRTTISVWLGLAACSVPSPGAAPEPPREPVPGPSLLRLWLGERAPLAREIATALALVVATADLSASNSAFPEKLRWVHRPEWMLALVQYTHASEGWSMFSPEAPVYDMMVVVDAVTRDGRHVDPYNEVGSRVATLPVNDIPPGLGHDSMFCDYTLRIPGTGAYHQAFSEWIQRYAERTGNPNDAIVSFKAIKLEHTPPAPGQTGATEVRSTVFLKWP